MFRQSDRSLADMTISSDPVRFAEIAFQNFSCTRFRQWVICGSEGHRSRQLVTRNVSATVLDELFFSDGCARFGHDLGVHGFTELVMRDTEDGGLGYALVKVDGVLNFGGVDVLPS